MNAEDVVVPSAPSTFVHIELQVFGSEYVLGRTRNLVGAVGETPHLSSVSIEVEDDSGSRFTMHFDDDRAIANFALRLLGEVEPFLTEPS